MSERLTDCAVSHAGRRPGRVRLRPRHSRASDTADTSDATDTTDTTATTATNTTNTTNTTDATDAPCGVVCCAGIGCADRWRTGRCHG
ncbi:MAG: hypothetical protein AMXMBFR57_36260 [Acidimicrobiia bacterium]